MGIADGWHTSAQSCAGPVLVQGPADQSVAMGLTWSVSTPDSLAVQNHRQMVASARQLGSPPPPFDMLVAPFTGPLDALENLAPQLSEMAVRRGGRPFQIDKPALRQEMRPSGIGGKAARVSYGLSEKGADGRVRQKTQQALNAQNQRFHAQQQSNREVTKAYERQHQDWEKNQSTTSRSHDDHDEVLRGYRTVEDTRNGIKTSVDPGNVDLIVDKLNEADPGRYRQIPLRDEMDPLPSR